MRRTRDRLLVLSSKPAAPVAREGARVSRAATMTETRALVLNSAAQRLGLVSQKSRTGLVDLAILVASTQRV
jgi:hypothetical protein